MYEHNPPRFFLYSEPDISKEVMEDVPLDSLVNPNETPRLREVSVDQSLTSVPPEILESEQGYTLLYSTCKKDTGKARLYLGLDGFSYWIPIACIIRDDMLEGKLVIINSFRLKPL